MSLAITIPKTVLLDTVEDFVATCTILDRTDVYDLGQDGITQRLRDEIYDKYSSTHANEPWRYAMIKLGKKFKVDSLINY